MCIVWIIDRRNVYVWTWWDGIHCTIHFQFTSLPQMLWSIQSKLTPASYILTFSQLVCFTWFPISPICPSLFFSSLSLPSFSCLVSLVSHLRVSPCLPYFPVSSLFSLSQYRPHLTSASVTPTSLAFSSSFLIPPYPSLSTLFLSYSLSLHILLTFF